MRTAFRKPPLAILGDADPGSDAFERAAGGQVPSVIPEGSMPPADWPATVVVQCRKLNIDLAPVVHVWDEMGHTNPLDEIKQPEDGHRWDDELIAGIIPNGSAV